MEVEGLDERRVRRYFRYKSPRYCMETTLDTSLPIDEGEKFKNVSFHPPSRNHLYNSMPISPQI